jgi:hypothetical protein
LQAPQKTPEDTCASLPPMAYVLAVMLCAQF